ncbi:MAG: tetratricopeptide repeat protein, partial [Pseudomonadota bacterium]
QSQITEFINKLAALSGDDGLSEAVEAAEAMLAEGAAVDAAQTFAAILGEEPANAAAFGGLVRSHLAMGETDQAKALLGSVPDEIGAAPEVEAARAQLELARQAADAGPVAELRAQVEADPTNNQARFDLAQALHADGNVEDAVAELLELFRRDREWNEGAAKGQLFTIFEALKPEDPIALNGRRKLSSMIFA